MRGVCTDQWVIPRKVHEKLSDYTRRSPSFGSEIVRHAKQEEHVQKLPSTWRRDNIRTRSCSSYSTIPEWKKKLPVEGGTAPCALRDRYGGHVRCVTHMVGHCIRGIRLCWLIQGRQK